jgi:transcriptional repressor NF-X1
VPASKRTFVLSLAQIYRLSTDLLDAEPNRSIMIRRKIDTRVPNPLLSSVVAQPATAERKSGGLANLRATPTASGTSSGTASWGKIAAPTPSPWGSSAASGSSTPLGLSAAGVASRAVSPAIRSSRPSTPGESHSATTMTVPVNQTSHLGPGLGLARMNSARQGVVGEVGKVEEDDWDVDA